MVLTVSPVAFRSGYFGPWMAQNQSVRFSPIRLLPVILLWVWSDSIWLDTPQTRSVDSSLGHDLAPLAGFMEAMGVAPERNGLTCSGLLAETTDTIINSRARSTRCLYAFKSWKYSQSVCSCHIYGKCTHRRCFSGPSSFGIMFYAGCEAA